MKRQFERYFELFPILAIIFIMMAVEKSKTRLQPVGFGLDLPAVEMPAPRLIFR